MSRRAWLMVLGLILVAAARADEPARDFPRPEPTRADEPKADKLSLDKAAAYMDGVAVAWTRERKCGTCHTNYPYLMARPLLDRDSAGLKEVRKFFEDRVANWDSGKDGAKPRGDTEVVATAVALAVNDAHSTGKLHPLTRQALDRMWTLQKASGAWDWNKCDWPPMEHDDYYGATYAALGVGLAPDGYAETDAAKAGLAKLRKYFQATPPPDLHHKTMLLWASQKVDGLMTADEKRAAIRELLAAQHEDGGWSLPSLGNWKRRDGTDNDGNAPSDGYATGLAVYVLRQAGVPADDAAVKKGVAWLRGNQRASGRWYTRSLNTDRAHFISNAGTMFAVLAILSAEPAPTSGPVTFEFVRMSGPAPGRKDAYDPETQTYQLEVKDIGRFRVKAVADDLEKRPVVLRIVGMLDRPEGPLELQLDGNRKYSLFHEGYDKELFKVERKDKVTTVEFLPAGKKLLKPGVTFQYIDFYRQ